MHPQGKNRLENIHLTAQEINKKASLSLGYKEQKGGKWILTTSNLGLQSHEFVAPNFCKYNT